MTDAKIVATYDYTSPDGTLLYQVLRTDPKGFRQRRPDGNGGWTYSLGDVERVLYRLPELAETPTNVEVYVPEGEKDVEALEEQGILATCAPGGATATWRPEYSEALRGRNVTIVADRDDPGYAHAFKVARALQGVAANVQVVEPAEGKDVTDHLAAGLGLDMLGIVEVPATPKRKSELGSAMVFDFGREPVAPNWLVGDLVELETVSILLADSGVGKSLLLQSLAVAMAQDRPWLGYHVNGKRTLYVDEENARSLVYRRLRAFGMTNDDRDLISYFCRAGIEIGRQPHADAIIREAEIFGPDLIIIDSALQATGIDIMSQSEVGRLYGGVLRPLADMGCAVVVIHHPRKSQAGFRDDPLDSGLGAKNWRNQADCFLHAFGSQPFTCSTRVDGHTFEHYACTLKVLKARDGKIGHSVRVEVISEHDARGRSLWMRTSVGVDEAREEFQRWRDAVEPAPDVSEDEAREMFQS